MKQLHQTTSLLLLLLSGWFAPSSLLAALQPVIPRLKGSGVGSNVNGYGTDVQVLGNLAFLAWKQGSGGDTNYPGGLEIFSIKNPTTPLRLGGYQSRAPVNAIKVVGTYACLAEGATRTLTNDPGVLEIIDVSDPTVPVRLADVNLLSRANDMRVSGAFAYVAEARRWTGTNLLGTLEIFDISAATNPIRVAVFDTAGSITSIDVSGDFAYLADGVTDLQVLDVTNPGNPRRVGVFNSDPAHNACGFEPGAPATFVQVVDNLAYSAGDNGLHVLDITNPSHPVSIGDNFCFPIYGFHAAGHFAYTLIWHSQLNTMFLHVADTTNPANLLTVGLKENWGAGPMLVVDNLIYVANIPLLVYEIFDRPAITSFSMKKGSLFLTWDFAPGYMLQRTPSLIDPLWSTVLDSAGNTSIWLPMTGGDEFFRLATP